MRSGASTSPGLNLAGPDLQAFARRQLARAAGLGLLVGVGLCLASLATWNVADPSFSHATANPVTNAVGYGGAAFSDLAMQFYGLASVAALAPAVFWGFFFIAGRGVDNLARRGLAWFGASVLFAGIAGCVTPPETWPLPTGLGGVFGDLVLKLPSLALGGYPTGWIAWSIAGVLALPALWLFAHAAGLLSRRKPEVETVTAAEVMDLPQSQGDEEDTDGGVLALGALTHWLLTAKGFLKRRLAIFGRRDRSDEPRGRDTAWRRAAEQVELAERSEARIDPKSRARIDPEFFAEMISDRRAAPEPFPTAEPRYQPEFEFEAEAETGIDPDEGDLGRPLEDLSVLMHSVEDVAPAITPPRPSNVRVQNFRSTPASRMQPPTAIADAPVPLPAAAGPGAPVPAMPAPAAPIPVAPVGVAPVRVAPIQMAPAAAIPARAIPTPPIPVAPVASVTPVARERVAPRPASQAFGFEMPTLEFLSEPKNVVRDASLSEDALEQNARILEGVLEDFGVKGEIIHVRPGPVVTLYELEPAPGIKSSRVIGLADDIARSMSAIAARVAVVPGRNAIGIELPNARRETVYLREILASHDFQETKARLALALGKTINGEAVIVDIAKMPHVLVAGTTGSGKSVAINTMILSLLYRMTPQECRLIMIDPKMLELSVYDGIPHLLTPVVTDPKKAVVALKWTVREMEDRYRKMSKVGVRNIDGFNARVALAQEKGERITRTVQTGFDRDTGEAIYETEDLDLQPLPYIVVIIDEMADLMMVAGKDIEGAVQRLAQMARAAGIHVIMATQRPSVDVITGTIKANFPTRISFQVTSKIDSRTILGEQGAEQLLGMGDMLYMAGGGRIQRVHGPFVSDDEVEKVVGHLKLQGAPEYLDSITEDDEEDEDDEPSPRSGGGNGASGETFDDSEDPYDQAVAVVLRDGKASTSYIQRRLGIGYNRAASIIERMEKEGIVGAANHAGKREILVPTEEDTM